MEENRTALTSQETEKAVALIKSVIENVEKEIVGKSEAIELVLTALLSRGHVLLEDVPGVGKTSLISCVARSIDCGFKRIQFTPDLMPSDVTGFSVFNQKSGEFEFRPGAVMSNLILADEINRASAKTQASLLEAMEEKQVTVDSITYRLDPPFMVMATQNPVESFGTYPLPEAQIDRFLLKLKIGYPSVVEEQQIIHDKSTPKAGISAVVDREDVIWLCEAADRVAMDDDIERYIVELVAATRTNSRVVLGSSPRGSIALSRTAKVHALMAGRNYVIPDDVKYLAPYVLAHRLILTHEAKTEKIEPEKIIGEILDSVIAPS
ncbi:MAG: MoxR family ATPase [Clostridiales bacterium]|nr:MoxR family ATPase [Clostridiales bacterium]